MFIGRTKGFTLAELLVVVAIIGLLASIVLLSINQARKRSEYTAIGQQLHQIELALNLYIADRYKNTWPRSHSNCQQLYRMVGGVDQYPNTGGCRSIANGSQHLLFNGFNTYLSGKPLDMEVLGFYLYQNPRPPNLTPQVSLKQCPDPYVSDPNNPGGGVLIRIGDEGDSLTSIPPLFDHLDAIYDNSDGPACGKIRMRNNADPEIYWILVENENDVIF